MLKSDIGEGWLNVSRSRKTGTQLDTFRFQSIPINRGWSPMEKRCHSNDENSTGPGESITDAKLRKLSSPCFKFYTPGNADIDFASSDAAL